MERVWAYVRETGATILDQLKRHRLPAATGRRTYFTLDEDLSRAVREVFVRLYEKGLIYRGQLHHQLVPPLPHRALQRGGREGGGRRAASGTSAIRSRDGSGFITVATTRPETMLGDTGVAVHPGRSALSRAWSASRCCCRSSDRQIPIVADDAVDPAFGTGAVKVTPAHDPADFEIGRRHDLPTHRHHDARRADERRRCPSASTASIASRRGKRVVAEFETLGLLEKVEPHRHAVAHCYRCDTVVEPRLSDQWFVKMAPLAKPALAAYRDGTPALHPRASRRRVRRTGWRTSATGASPGSSGGAIAFRSGTATDGCGKTIVSRDDLRALPALRRRGAPGRGRARHLVLLLARAVLAASAGRERTARSRGASIPATPLVTAPEILFFWVARMIMAGFEFMGEVPFHTVYLHGTVRDTQHRKMSKSLGNGIDPLEVVERYGADALRYTVVAGMAVGTDVILDPGRPRDLVRAGPQLRQQALERRPLHPVQSRRARRAHWPGAHRTSCGRKS